MRQNSFDERKIFLSKQIDQEENVIIFLQTIEYTLTSLTIYSISISEKKMCIEKV